MTDLEHLNESDTEVEVGHVTTDQRQAEEEANRHNGTQVDSTGHLDILSSIKEGGGSSQDLGHESAKSQMPGGQDDGELKALGVQNPFIKEDDT